MHAASIALWAGALLPLIQALRRGDAAATLVEKAIMAAEASSPRRCNPVIRLWSEVATSCTDSQVRAEPALACVRPVMACAVSMGACRLRAVPLTLWSTRPAASRSCALNAS